MQIDLCVNFVLLGYSDVLTQGFLFPNVDIKCLTILGCVVVRVLDRFHNNIITF